MLCFWKYLGTKWIFYLSRLEEVVRSTKNCWSHWWYASYSLKDTIWVLWAKKVLTLIILAIWVDWNTSILLGWLCIRNVCGVCCKKFLLVFCGLHLKRYLKWKTEESNKNSSWVSSYNNLVDSPATAGSSLQNWSDRQIKTWSPISSYLCLWSSCLEYSELRI